ncbi:MAG TPA: ATP-binding protein, partial [bacterium]|nr:ATP-binding protein [bacterium]
NRAIGKAARIVILAVLIAATIAASLVFRFVLHTGAVTTHLMYLPIALACMWWGAPGIAVAAGLSAVVLLSHVFGAAGQSLWSDVVRCVLFLTVGVLIARMRDRVEAGRAALARSESATGEAEEKRRELLELSRRQEEQLEHSTRLAELGEMAAAISHELNQPLTGIRNYARNAFYMIDQKAGGEAEVKNNLRLISEQVDRAARIISQMRELTRRSDSIFNMLELNSVIRESVEFLLPQMRLSEVTVSLPLSEELPPIWGDRIRLAQVFLNLLSNARQAMEGAPVRRLTVATRQDAAAALPVVVEVSDTGKGFSDEQARRLFQPFYTTRKGGHGLGLSISRAIVQDHKGTIEATGAPGMGATFIIRLPAAPRESTPSGERRD